MSQWVWLQSLSQWTQEAASGHGFTWDSNTLHMRIKPDQIVDQLLCVLNKQKNASFHLTYCFLRAVVLHVFNLIWREQVRQRVNQN